MDELDDLFLAAKAAAPAPSTALVARVLADAAAAQPRPAAPSPVPRAGWFAWLADAFGGRGVVAGLAGTAVVGLVLGFYVPALATDWSSVLSAETVELIPDADSLFASLEEQG